MKKSKILLPKTENHEPLFADMLQTHYLSKLKCYFSFMEVLSNKSENSKKNCSELIQKNTMLHFQLK